MNRLFRLQLQPLSSWRTLWQADTIAGMLCWMCARTEGEKVLRESILEPAQNGNPPFVLSDAFPAGLLPVPRMIFRQKFDEKKDAIKKVKRGKWVDLERFNSIRAGNPVSPDNLEEDPYTNSSRHHNTIGRSQALDEGGLFTLKDISLPSKTNDDEDNRLDIYLRIQPGMEDFLLGLFYELSLIGFGADSATGRGQFKLKSIPIEEVDLNAEPPNADGIIVLSTFQPSKTDSAEGYWDAFAKFGKIGPDFGLENHQVKKNTLIMLRPGACLRCDPITRFTGRLILPEELLPKSLQEYGISQYAFGLAIPACVPLNRAGYYEEKSRGHANQSYSEFRYSSVYRFVKIGTV